jgi:hypothetical protein
MSDKLIIRTSDRSTFKKCRQLWEFSSKIRLDYEPLRPKDYFEFGTAWHAAMEVWYYPNKGGLPPFLDPLREEAARAQFLATNAFQRKQQEELGFGGPDTDIEYAEREKLGQGMLSYYFGWSRIHDDFEPITVEHEFEVPITRDGGARMVKSPSTYYDWWVGDAPLPEDVYEVKYQGRIDGLVRDFRGHYFLLEHKSIGRESPTKWLQIDDQVGSYAWAMQKMLDIPIKGVIYTRSYKRYPEPPKILRDGSISCDKRQQTTASLFVEAVESAHPFRPAAETIADDDKYLNYHQFLTNPEVAPKFVERHITTRNPNQIEDIGKRIAMEAQDMLNDPFIYPNVSSINCNACSFFGPCLTKQDGGDWKYHLKSEFRKRDNG